MVNHPNRSGSGPSRNPTPAEIRELREETCLTREQAADLVHGSRRGWEKWEAPEGTEEHRRMHPGLWELFRIKCQRIRVTDIAVNVLGIK